MPDLRDGLLEKKFSSKLGIQRGGILRAGFIKDNCVNFDLTAHTLRVCCVVHSCT